MRYRQTDEMSYPRLELTAGQKRNGSSLQVRIVGGGRRHKKSETNVTALTGLAVKDSKFAMAAL